MNYRVSVGVRVLVHAKQFIILLLHLNNVRSLSKLVPNYDQTFVNRVKTLQKCHSIGLLRSRSYDGLKHNPYCKSVFVRVHFKMHYLSRYCSIIWQQKFRRKVLWNTGTFDAHPNNSDNSKIMGEMV